MPALEIAKSFRPKEYIRPMSVEEAVSILAKYGSTARVIAGGTSLLVKKPPEVQRLIDITRLPLNYIESDDEGIRVGALTTFRRIEKCTLFKEWACILAEVAHEFGPIHIRNVATIGGNICSALSIADSPIALIALDAKVKLTGANRERAVPLEEFFIDIGKTVLRSDELLMEVQIPEQPAFTTAAFLKIGRTARDIALVNVAVRVTLGVDRACKEARIVLGGVSPIPIRARKAEELLEGKRIGDALIEQAALSATQELKPRPTFHASSWYKAQVSKFLVRRALKRAIERQDVR